LCSTFFPRLSMPWIRVGYGFAKYGMLDAADEVDSCTGSKKSPLAGRKQLVLDLCGVTVAIINILLKKWISDLKSPFHLHPLELLLLLINQISSSINHTTSYPCCLLHELGMERNKFLKWNLQTLPGARRYRQHQQKNKNKTKQSKKN
jgi:hypothetical protein